MSEDGRTFLDDFLDKAEAVVSGLERVADGNKGILPMDLDDGSRIIADSMAGGRESTDGEPNWIVLCFIDPNGQETRRRYRRDPVTPDKAKVIDIGGDGR